MTKEEAVRIAQGLITDFKCKSETMVEFCNVVIKALKQQPCDDVEWVSVLNEPPSKDGRYYVTRHDSVTQTDFTDILWYEKGVWWNRQATGDYAVIAWQLLPQPYKAESEEV